jgi:hypothetical protein
MRRRIAVITLLGVLGLAVSCGDDGGGSAGPNLPPTTSIQSLELLPDQQYRAHIVWTGDDPDGRVSYYEVAWQAGQVMLGTPLFEDELTWEKVTVNESTFTLSADLCSDAGTCSTSYTFFVRAVDNGGAVDTNPPYESFTTFTVLPESWFTYPSPGETTQPNCLRLAWNGSDDDGEVVEYRMARKPYYEYPPGEPPPEWDPTKWSEWTTSTDTVLTNFYSDPLSPMTIFLQARDNAGALEKVYRSDRNILVVHVAEGLATKPSATLQCFKGPCYGKLGPMIASRTTSNPGNMDVPVQVFEGDTLCFKSFGEPGEYATRLTGLVYSQSDYPGIYWKTPSDSGNWYYPSEGGFFVAGPGEYTLYFHLKDNYCEWGSQTYVYMKVYGNPPPPE